MRCFLAALIVATPLFAYSQTAEQPTQPTQQWDGSTSLPGNRTPDPPAQNPPPVVGTKGSFFVSGVAYEYIVGKDYTVIAAATPHGNHKYLGVSVRVINTGDGFVTVKPQDVVLEDAVAAHNLSMIPASDVAKHVRSESVGKRFLQGAGMGMEMASQEDHRTTDTNSSGNVNASDQYGNVYSGTYSGTSTSTASSCDAACQSRKSQIAERYTQEQRRRNAIAMSIEQTAFLANTISPKSNVEGTIYFPMPKMSNAPPVSKNGKKNYMVSVTVPVGVEKFQFVFPLE